MDSSELKALNSIQVRIHGDSMWPTFKDGDFADADADVEPVVGDIVVVKHPLKNISIVKRIKRISNQYLFVEGDNPDPTGSDDSHNFGLIPTSAIIAVIRL